MPSTATKRLLFVDDEPSIRVTLSVVLQKHGFRVQTAATVPEAIAEIDKKPFDVLLCDLNISEPADGYRVVDAMRQVNPNAAIVILTGYLTLTMPLKEFTAELTITSLNPLMWAS